MLAVLSVLLGFATAAADPTAKPTDPQIAHIAYTADQLDIEAAKQALQKSKNPQVIAFANQMVGDHTSVNNQALALVKKLNVTPEDNPTSQTLTKQADATRNKLASLEGAAFDKAYVDNEVAYHKTVNTALSGTLIPDAQNPELKALLQRPDLVRGASEARRTARRPTPLGTRSELTDMASVALSYETLSDIELARRIAQRDSMAARLVIKRNNQRLYRAAWSVLKDRSEAEEAVQDGYLKAFAAIGSFAGKSSLSTWLTRIVLNEALGQRRSAQRRSRQLREQSVAIIDEYREKLMSGSDGVMSPEADVARSQIAKLLEAAVADLPEAFRLVLMLRDVDGLSVEETAEVLQISPQTVKTRLLRARDGCKPLSPRACAML